MQLLAFVLWAVLPVAAGGPAAQGAPPTDGKLLVSAAIPAVHQQRNLQVGGSLDVVIVNTSDQTQRVWRDWCSWGYYNLSLEFRDGDGNTWVCEKKPRGWTKNYPDAAELAAGESIIFRLELGDEIWDKLPKVAAGAERKLEMRVRYAIDKDEDATRQQVWTGNLATRWQSVRVTRK